MTKRKKQVLCDVGLHYINENACHCQECKDADDLEKIYWEYNLDMLNDASDLEEVKQWLKEFAVKVVRSLK